MNTHRLDPLQQRLAQALEELSRIQLALDEERLVRLEGDFRFDVTLASMSDAVLIVNPQGKITLANDAAADLIGKSATDLVGTQPGLYFADEVPVTSQMVLKATPSGAQTSLETAIETARGTVPISLSYGLIQDPNGKFLGAVYAARDLSETQTLARDLDKERDRWRLLVSLNDLLVEQMDPLESLPKVCTEVNSATGLGIFIFVIRDGSVTKVAGSDRALGSLPRIFGLEGKPVPRSSTLRSSFETGKVIYSSELKAGFPLFGPGLSIESLGSAAVIPLVAGEYTEGVMTLLGAEPGSVSPDQVSLGTEMGRRIAATLVNARLRASVSQLKTMREASRMREQLVSSVSHDMKTPLSVLLGALTSLRSSPEAPVQDRMNKYVAMSRQASNLHRLVQQFLDYTRLESGRDLVVRPRPVQMVPTIRKVVEDFANQTTFELDVPEDLPKIIGDPDRVDQILANLISNAIKFSPAGSPVAIAARVEGRFVRISVSDQGRGMSPPELANLFQKFYRAPSGQDTSGTGLGLFMCKQLVEAQGGRIIPLSRLGEGTEISFMLPLAETEAR